MKTSDQSLLRKRQLLLFLGDFFIATWFVAAYYAGRGGWNIFLRSAAVFLPYALVFYVADLYNPQRNFRQARELVRTAAAVAAGFVFYSLVFSFIPRLSGRFHLLLFSNNLVYVTAWRFVFGCLRNLRPAVKRCLVVGAGQAGAETQALVAGDRQSGLAVAGFVDDDPAKQGQAVDGGARVLGRVSDLGALIGSHGIDTVILALPTGGQDAVTLDALVRASETGVEITDSPAVFARHADRIPLSHVDGLWVVLALVNKSSYYLSPLKRALDICVAGAGLVVSLPCYLLVPPLIRLTSRGPVFYRQARLGMHGQVFRTVKFRTMVPDAEREQVFSTRDNDRRITRVGRVLRRWKIDELPQFINVLRGEMSVVGPRPISARESRQNDYARHIRFWSVRFFPKPGVTGWAQVNYPYGASIGEATRRFEYDLFYLRHNSFVLDLLVLLKTVKCVFYLRGR